MPTYYELANHADSVAASYKNQIEIKATLVGMPLYYVGDVSKKIFSNVLGFEWFLKFSLRFNLPGVEFSLPAVMYALGYASELAAPRDR